MPVGVLDRRPPRLPRLGIIHLGIRAKTQSGKEYPQKIDYMDVREDDHTSKAAADAFHEVYGMKPREIDVIIPVQDESLYMPTWLQSYRAGVGLFCKGSGQEEDGSPGVAVRVYDPEDMTLAAGDVPAGTKAGAMISVPQCSTETCPIYTTKRCRLMSRLLVLLPKVAGLGVWQITTGSWNSVQNLRGGIRFVEAFTAGRIAGVPLKLRLVPQQATAEGKKVTIYVLQIANDNMRLLDVLESAKKTWEQVLALPAPADIDDDEIPDSHFPEEAAKDRDLRAGAVETIGAVVQEGPEASAPEPVPAAAPAAAPAAETSAPRAPRARGAGARRAAAEAAPAAPPPAPQNAPPPEAEQGAPDPTWVELHERMTEAGWFPAKQRAKVTSWKLAGLDDAGMLAAFLAESGTTEKHDPAPGRAPAAADVAPAAAAPAAKPFVAPPAPAAGGRPSTRNIWAAMR